NISSGTVADTRLSGNVALLGAATQTFTGADTFGTTLTTGTGLLVNTAAGFSTTGTNLLDLQVNTSSKFSEDKAGSVTFAGTATGNGSGLTSLNGSNISSGTVADTRLSSNVTLQGNPFNGSTQLVQ